MNPEFLKQVQIFEGLSDAELAEILMLGAVKEYAKDDLIFEDGATLLGITGWLSPRLCRR